MVSKLTPSVLLLAAAVIFAQRAAADDTAHPFPQPQGWPPFHVIEQWQEPLGPGVWYDRYRLLTDSGPLAVHVTTVDLRNPLVSLVAALHRGVIVGADEPLSAMADRAHAEAAINADYFDINESGAPLNVVAVSGRMLHEPNGAAALVVGPGNAVTMGPVSLAVNIADAAGSTLSIASINDWSGQTGMSLLTAEFGTASLGADMEVVLTPAAQAGSYRVAVVAQAITQLLPLGPADLGIVARGAEQVGRLAPFGTNDVVSVSYAGDPPPNSIAFAVGGGPMLLRDGQPTTDAVVPAAQEANVRYPVSGAGVSADGSTLWLVAVDGRSPGRSIGITRPILASLFASLGAAQAMAFDSGGSTEMAIRHGGDQTVSVANTPSDGRERSIADALLVVNAATPGPLDQLLIRVPFPTLLAGSHARAAVEGVDANFQPVTVDPATVRYSVDSSCCVTVDGSGAIATVAPGQALVTAKSGGASTSAGLVITIVGSVDTLTVGGYARDAAVGSTLHLTAAAATKDGIAIGVDPSAVTWTSSGDGRIRPDGTFVAGASPGIADVTAQAGGARAMLRVLVGDHPVALPAGDWRFSSSPATVFGSVDRLAAPVAGRGAAVHLDYDFGAGGSTRAAYANAQIAVAGDPLGFSFDVYGDGNGEWLRGAYRNADGVIDTITLARHVDWSGWKTIRVDLPVEARTPVVLTRIYAVETRRDALESGDLWFAGLTAWYAGPPAASP